MRLSGGEALGGLWLVVLAGCLVLERWRPARCDRAPDLANNLGAWLAAFAANVTATPLAGGLATLAINGLGGGLVTLPHRGWGLVAGILAYLLAMDGGEYLFHRAQHANRWLWAMHSLHHSDPALSVTTAARHFWLEPALKSVTIWLAVGLLFRASPEIVALYAVLHVYNLVLHANVRLHLGPLARVINSPQQHRLHHSPEARHHGRNFAALLSLFDILGGTYLAPLPAEFPPTGLAERRPPSGVGQILAWPWVKAESP